MSWMRSSGSVLVFAVAAIAQQDEIVQLKSDSRLVEVRVIVEDNNGRPVRTLNQKGFALTDNGKAKAIQVFAGTEDDGPNATRPEPVLPAGVFSNRFGRRSERPITAILLDQRMWSPQSVALAMAGQIARQMESGEQMAVWVSTPEVRLIQDFTADPSRLAISLAGFKPPLPPPGGEIPRKLPPYPAASILTTLGQIATRLAVVPGRKNILWITEGFSSEINESGVRAALEAMTIAFNDADVALYVLDPRQTPCAGVFGAGQPMPTGTTAPPGAGGALSSAGPASRQATCIQIRDKNDDRMNEIAQGTGGIGIQFHDIAYNSDLQSLGSMGVRGQVRLSKGDNPVTDARLEIANSRYNYELGFYVNDDDMDGKVHRIGVTVIGRPKLVLRYRKQYTAFLDSREVDKTLDVSTPPMMVDANDIGMDVKVEPICDNACRRLKLTMSIETASIKRSDGLNGNIDETFTETDANGREVGKVDLTLRASWPTDRPMVTYEQLLKLDEGAVSLHIRLRDQGSGRVGMLTVPLRGIPGLR